MPFDRVIRLAPPDVEYAARLADLTLETFSRTRGYYRNTVRSPVIGKVGERCAARWLEGLGHLVEPAFANQRESATDLISNGLQIETKTWDEKWLALSVGAVCRHGADEGASSKGRRNTADLCQ